MAERMQGAGRGVTAVGVVAVVGPGGAVGATGNGLGPLVAAAEQGPSREGRWLVLRRPFVGGSDGAAGVTGAAVAAGALGAPGPWRVAAPGLAVFELPVASWGDRWRRDARGAAADLMDWARATRDGLRVPGWEPPPREQVAAWLPAERLVVRTGASSSLGELVHAPGTLRLQFPLASRGVAGLPASRRRWLAASLVTARARWRFVRVGLPRDGGPPRAEVDLSGAPPELLEPLVTAALCALRWVVAWSLPPLAVLIDTGIASSLLDSTPSRARPAERK